MTKTIYKKDSKEKIRVITYTVKGNQLITESGLLDGKKVINTKVCKAKNVGRSNEKTAEEQAVFEMNSKITDKLTKGYFKTKEEAEATNFISPMLAKSYKKRMHKVEYPCYSQPKLDGMRALITIKDGEITMKSRDGKLIDPEKKILTNIWEDLKKFPDGIYDGELYLHDKIFEEIMQMAKKKRPNKSLIYHIFDMISDKPFYKRFKDITNIFQEITSDSIKMVLTQICYNKQDVDNHNKKCIEQGYEGTMVRNKNSKYTPNKRSDDLLKYKHFLDTKCELIDIIPGDQKPEYGVPVLKALITEHGITTGETFRGGWKNFTKEQQAEMLTNKSDYIGKTCEFRFFEATADGKARFGSVVGFIN